MVLQGFPGYDLAAGFYEALRPMVSNEDDTTPSCAPCRFDDKLASSLDELVETCNITLMLKDTV